MSRSPSAMTTPRTPEGRVSRVAHGATINGTYRLPPGEALDAFREDLKELVERPTADAYTAACRANHWRAAQLRAHGIEPCTIPLDAPHYPPDGHDFGAPSPDELTPNQVAAMLGVNRRTLFNWRMDGQGPKARMRGGRIVYAQAEVEAYKRERRA